MYQQSNKNAAVKEIQTYLYLISDRMYADVPRIPIDGIYDSETEAAVTTVPSTSVETDSTPTTVIL